VGLKTMILRENVEEIDGMDALARELGVPFRLDPQVTPRLNGDLQPLEQRLDPERAVEVEMRVDAYRESMTEAYRDRQAEAGEQSRLANRIYLCGAGQTTFHVDPRGTVHPCIMSQIGYDAVSMGFGAAWHAIAGAVDAAICEGVNRCAGCADILLCGYCPGIFALEGASPAQPPGYVCRLGELRRRAVGSETMEVVGVNAS